MASLRDVVAYLGTRYPHKHELSNARVTKMVYLADWKSAIDRGCQLTNIRWVYNHYGPYVDDILETVHADESMSATRTTNMYGGLKDLILVEPDTDTPTLTEEDKKILDHVIKITAPKYWNDFIKLVYSTYPIVALARYSDLDLVELASDYKAAISAKRSQVTV